MKPHTAVVLFCITLTFFIAALNSCTVNVNECKDETKIVYVYADTAKYIAQIKKLNKKLRFRTYQRDSLQCKIDSFIYSIIKTQEQWQQNLD